MRSLSGLLFIVLLSGCAGYAADYWKPKERLIAPQLTRYGMAGPVGACVQQRLMQNLRIWQLRQLVNLAEKLETGGGAGGALGPREFVYIAGLVEDPEVGPATASAISECGISTDVPRSVIAEAAPETKAAETSSVQAPPAPVTPPLWVNLGAAKSGQAIAVDAATVSRGPSWRQAWFRLLNWDRPNIGDVGYLLRVDCQAKAITAHAGRKYAPGGALIEQKDYAAPEGPMGIEPGTVIEVAYHALCDEPR